MRMNHSHRGRLKETDSEVVEMQGFLDLGMRRECLALARRVLRRRRLDANAFTEALQAVLIHAHDVRRWVPQIESAHDRLSRHGRVRARLWMFRMYSSIEHWSSAESHLPAHVNWPVDLLFMMHTLLNLRQDSSAAQLYRRCLRIWRHQRIPADQIAGRELEMSALIEAIASYLAQAGRWDEAEKWWKKGAVIRPLAARAWEGLLMLNVVRALVAVKCGLAVAADQDWLDADGIAIMLPGIAKACTKEEGNRLRLLETKLAKILPEKDRFRFGATLL